MMQIMEKKPCDCNPCKVISSIVGEKCHVVNDRGEWCAVVNEKGVYLQTLLVPSESEIAKNQEQQAKIEADSAEQSIKESRIAELKEKLASGAELTVQELTELLKLTI